MSFGPTAATSTAQGNLGNISNTLTGSVAPQDLSQGSNLFGLGQGNVQSGTNFLNTVLNGNAQNTGALLQPQINQIRQGNQQNLQAASTLMPRGGGRSGSLFDLSTQPQGQVQNLFNGARTTAATTLPQIGLQQQGLGANLFGLGTNALTGAAGTNSQAAQIAQQQQQLTNNFWSQLGGGVLGLATMPFGGGTAVNGLLGKL